MHLSLSLSPILLSSFLSPSPSPSLSPSLPQSYGADELFATAGGGRLRQRSKQPSESIGAGPSFQRQISLQHQTSAIQRQTSQVHIQYYHNRHVPTVHSHTYS